jgi:exopolysaccharide biosynthesis polyprenyl glycosylphosphotransferase
MIREKEGLITGIFSLADALFTVISSAVAFWILQSVSAPSVVSFNYEYLILLLIIMPLWYILIKVFNLRKINRTRRYSLIFLDYAKVIGIGISIILIIRSLAGFTNVNQGVILLFAVLNLNILFISKIILFRILKSFRFKGNNIGKVVIIADDTAEKLIDKIIRFREWGYQITHIISDSEKLRESYENRFTFLPCDTDIRSLLDTHVVDEVIYNRNEIDQKRIKEIVQACEEVGVVFRMQTQLYSMKGTKTQVNYFDHVPFLTFSNTPNDYLTLFFKWAFSFIASFIILLIWSPIMMLIALAIKLDSKGPVFFSQKRVGLRGRTFNILKFRTMVADAEKLRPLLENNNEMDGPAFKIENDPRITRMGRFLRKTGLDELPQFINILKGEMTLVGPRPPIPKEVDQYQRWQRRRLSMKPGITCTWQVQRNRNKIPFEEWMKLDLQYIDSWTIFKDISLFFRTFRTFISPSGK